MAQLREDARIQAHTLLLWARQISRRTPTKKLGAKGGLGGRHKAGQCGKTVTADRGSYVGLQTKGLRAGAQTTRTGSTHLFHAFDVQGFSEKSSGSINSQQSIHLSNRMELLGWLKVCLSGPPHSVLAKVNFGPIWVFHPNFCLFVYFRKGTTLGGGSTHL